jgi:hypothetical protein
MARALVTEQESGTCRGWMHPHNGYYAGDFSSSWSVIVETTPSASSRRMHLVPEFAARLLTSTRDRPGDRRGELPRAA